MRTRDQIDELIEKGVELLRTCASLCGVTAVLCERGLIEDHEEFFIDVEVEEIGEVSANPYRDSGFLLGKPRCNKKLRATILALAIEKLYGEGDL